MVAKLLDGSRVARLIRADLAKTVQRAATLIGRPPGLAVVQVGRNTFVSLKAAADSNCSSVRAAACRCLFQDFVSTLCVEQGC